METIFAKNFGRNYEKKIIQRVPTFRKFWDMKFVLVGL